MLMGSLRGGLSVLGVKEWRGSQEAQVGTRAKALGPRNRMNIGNRLSD